jgi:hypothetical protein
MLHSDIDISSLREAIAQFLICTNPAIATLCPLRAEFTSSGFFNL